MRLAISGAQSVDHTTRGTSIRVVPVTIGGIAAIYVAWVGAWLLKGALDRHVAWVASPGGAFAYWTTMKLLLWIVPSIALIRLSGRPLREVFGPARLWPAVVWGVAGGLLLGVISLTTKAVLGRPLLSVALSWPLLSVLVVAPVFEEFVFRGAVLGNLLQRYRFPIANTLTALLFVGLHLPGWYFQGRLWANLVSPVSGAPAIFLLGWFFGFVTHRSRSVVAGMLAHSLSNLFS